MAVKIEHQLTVSKILRCEGSKTAGQFSLADSFFKLPTGSEIWIEKIIDRIEDDDNDSD